MDEKTAELRDIFLDATGADTVTDSQEEARGSLTTDDASVSERLSELVATMRERYEFATSLSDDDLVAVARGFHDGEADDAVAADLGVDPETVFEARMDLHLVAPADREAPFDLATLRSPVVEGADVETAAAELDADPGVVAHYRRVAEADARATRANERFRDEFADLLTDAELSTRHVRDAREDGLREATEDIETDVSL
jgi:hypothetical protein